MGIPRQKYVKWLAVLPCLACCLGTLSAADPGTLLKGVESRYNHAKTLQVAFSETYTGQGRPKQSASGQLTLRKPGRMRWEYSTPPGKLFLSDGKQAYLYTPDLNRVERVPLKESEDLRAPLAFLLGKLDFNKEFREFQIKPLGQNFQVSAAAKNDKLPYERIEMTITPAFEIRRLTVNGQDRSVLVFEFDQEKMNLPVDDRQFQFQMPPGATLVNGDR